MSAAALIHRGTVSHLRLTPRHRFVYRIWMVSLDLDRLDTLGLRLFGHNRAAPIALHDRDHGPRDGSPLRPWVEAALARAGLGQFGAGIRLVVIPRVFGYAFNPIAFYFCYDAAGRLGAVLHQVKNTFGAQVGYLLAASAGSGAIIQSAAKRMHVSPFFDMQGGYRFAFSAPDFTPGWRFAIAIRYGTEAAPRLFATLRLDAAPMTDATLARLLLAAPFGPLKLILAIHYEALRLWWRGARFHRAPPPPSESVILG